MRKKLEILTSGFSNIIRSSVIWATLDAACRMVPSIIAFYGILELFEAFRNERRLDLNRFAILAVCSVIWFLVQMIVSAFAYDKAYLAAYDVSAKGRIALADHLRKLPLGYLEKRNPGDLTTMVLGDYAYVETAISHIVPQGIAAFIVLVITGLGLMFLDWRMTVSLYAMLPLTILCVKLSNRLMVKLGGNHVAAKVASTSRLQEYLFGIKDIKAYSLGGTKFSNLDNAFNHLRKESIKLEGILGPVVMTAISVLKMGFSLVVFTGSYFLIGGKMDVVIFLVFIVVATRVYDPFTLLLMNYTEMKYAMISAERIMEIRQQDPVTGSFRVDNAAFIEFKDVKFSYQDTPTLDGINLTIKPQSLTALVGPSGSGKSTIVKLIARFYEVDEGQITLSGLNLQNIDPEDLYAHISMVFQDVYLFNDTIINNIRIGNQGASDHEIYEAAKKAQCHDFIMALPNGYETKVGEGGSTLSGGEKQRLSIARAFLKNAEIILLDEATASLDLENEAAVQRAIGMLVQEKTVIVIAHRLNTIMHADHIAVLQEGRIVSQGTHEFLYESCELYHHLVDMQNEAKQWKFQ
ncbi:ABC transporter ATP-binding protein [Erysipelothrix aquatica]|uniref:ABC transporter ATP-binding protein n=1 Tax=Erysipelothrix aquatica TaxID=2683714 RepID=UPI00135AA387|nr:ABC transporter ATP-binding protein [Erysipelothrix aquatica]